MYLSSDTVLTTLSPLKGSQVLASKTLCREQKYLSRICGQAFWISLSSPPSSRSAGININYCTAGNKNAFHTLLLVCKSYFDQLNLEAQNRGQITCYVARIQVRDGKHCGLCLFYFLLPEQKGVATAQTQKPSP